MKKILVVVTFFMLSLVTFAQQETNILLQRELQIEIGESNNLLRPILSSIFSPSEYRLEGAYSPTVALSYNNSIGSRWMYGVSLAYNRRVERMLHDEGAYLKQYSIQDIRSYAIVPSVKYLYKNTETLQMYSGLQAGMCIADIPYTVYGAGKERESSSTIGFFGQLTLFGITYGRGFYVGAEAGIGFKGVLNFVSGYRF
jgi:hypothetical protein